MTRTERLARAEEQAKLKLEAQRKRLTQVQQAQMAEARKALAKRRYLVGQMVEDAGLFVLSDADLAGLFALLESLAAVPNPVAVLEGLLADEVLESRCSTNLSSTSAFL